MIQEMILRISNINTDVEICSRDGSDISYKAIEKKELINILGQYCNDDAAKEKKDITLLNNQIIGIGSSSVLIKQEGHERIVTLSIYSEKSSVFKINMPNSLYILHYRDSAGKRIISSIEAYSYKKFNGLKTKLFEYPMPNEWNGNRICIGTAPREIIDCDYVGALDRVIYTPYSHANLTSVNEFTNSLKWFEYLSEHEFPYNLLRPLNKKLENVLRG